MIVALYILAAIVIVGLILKLTDKHFKAVQPSKDSDKSDKSDKSDSSVEEECCGMHITCERDSLLSSVSDKAEYFDDEDLDRFAGRAADDYTDDEIEEFRDVLLTLLPDDIAPWGRSVQLRGITLPTPVREELLMLVAEEREKRAKAESPA